MAKISLNKLNLNKNTEIKIIHINGQEVEVIQYLPVKEKMDLIESTIQESMFSGYCNPILIDVIFHTYVVMAYTNIGLSPTQKENLLDTYDLLEKSGVIGEVISAISIEEYSSIRDSLFECIEVAEKETNSVISLITGAIDRVAESFEATKDALSGVDLNSENIQSVLKIAKDNGAI